jgi:hypothetical protein
MHGYDTGTGTAAKKNNWGQLERTFVKLEIPVPKDMLQDISSSKGDAAALCLSIIFSHVNKR